MPWSDPPLPKEGVLLCTCAGLWVGDCFIYTNGAWRLNYCVGGEVTTMFHMDRPMYLLGYLAAQSKVYLIDKVRAPGPCPSLGDQQAPAKRPQACPRRLCVHRGGCPG